MYRRGQGYITATRYEINGEDTIVEKVSSIDNHGHEHQVNEQKVTKGREKHILDLHKEHLKMIEKHQKAIDEELENLALRKEEAAKQRESVAADINLLESRVGASEKRG